MALEKPLGGFGHAFRHSLFQALYQWAFRGQDAAGIAASFRDCGHIKQGLSHAFEPTLADILAAIDTLDAHLAPQTDYPLHLVGMVERSILRLACYELLHCPQTPAAVAIHEAVNLAHEFSPGNSYKLINGVLDRLSANLRPKEARRDPAAGAEPAAAEAPTAKGG